MAYTIERADHFYTTITEQPGQRYQLLSQLAGLGVNLLAFTAMPFGPMRGELTLMRDEAVRMIEAAREARRPLDGPHTAVLVQGDDELEALARIHTRLHEARVHLYASAGVSEGRGAFGYIPYVRPEDYDREVKALSV